MRLGKREVWSLAPFFGDLYVKKNAWTVNRLDSSSGQIFSVVSGPATPSFRHQTLEGLFELIWHRSSVFKLSFPELQRCKDTIIYITLSAKVPQHC